MADCSFVCAADREFRDRYLGSGLCYLLPRSSLLPILSSKDCEGCQKQSSQSFVVSCALSRVLGQGRWLVRLATTSTLFILLTTERLAQSDDKIAVVISLQGLKPRQESSDHAGELILVPDYGQKHRVSGDLRITCQA